MASKLSTHHITPRAEYGYIPGLDGLRAMAVMIVLIAHLGWSGIVPGGFGVTVFFFISGFLITRLLLAESDKKGGFGLKNFYIRRFLRLLPALFVMLIATGGVMLVTGTPMPFGETIAAFTYTMNYHYAYMGITGGTGVTPWHHLWSLGVEEHFYLLFPLLLIFVRKNWKTAIKLGLSICALALIWRTITHYALNLDTAYNYAATEARLDSILYGCLLSLGLHVSPDHKAWNWIKGYIPVALAGAAILASFLIRDEGFRDTFRYSLQGWALFIGVFNLMFWKPMAVFVKMLENAILRWIGQVSYGLYLWHVPFIFLAVNMGMSKGTMPMVLFVLATTFAATAASFYWIEKPIVKLRKKYGSHTREDGKKAGKKPKGLSIPAAAE